MSTNIKPREDIRDFEENSFALAIAVLQNRISELPADDKEDLFQLIPLLFDNDPEERESASRAVREIMGQGKSAVLRADLPKTPGSELRSWTSFVSAKIREERTKANLTQEQLAEMAGIPQSHVSRLENGQHSPTAMTIEKIAKALGIPPSKLDPSAEDGSE